MRTLPTCRVLLIEGHDCNLTGVVVFIGVILGGRFDIDVAPFSTGQFPTVAVFFVAASEKIPFV